MQIYILNNAIRYIIQNEYTSSPILDYIDIGMIKIVHLYGRVEDIPSEFESNYRILDEIYPSVTIELVFVQAQFNPAGVLAVSKKLGIPTSFSFIQCPGEALGWQLGDLGSVRVILL